MRPAPEAGRGRDRRRAGARHLHGRVARDLGRLGPDQRRVRVPRRSAGSAAERDRSPGARGHAVRRVRRSTSAGASSTSRCCCSCCGGTAALVLALRERGRSHCASDCWAIVALLACLLAVVALAGHSAPGRGGRRDGAGGGVHGGRRLDPSPARASGTTALARIGLAVALAALALVARRRGGRAGDPVGAVALVLVVAAVFTPGLAGHASTSGAAVGASPTPRTCRPRRSGSVGWRSSCSHSCSRASSAGRSPPRPFRASRRWPWCRSPCCWWRAPSTATCRCAPGAGSGRPSTACCC